MRVIVADLPKTVGPLDGTSLPCPALSAVTLFGEARTTHVSLALEQDRLMAGSFRVGKCRDSCGGFVFEAVKHLVQIMGT